MISLWEPDESTGGDTSVVWAGVVASESRGGDTSAGPAGVVACESLIIFAQMPDTSHSPLDVFDFQLFKPLVFVKRSLRFVFVVPTSFFFEMLFV